MRQAVTPSPGKIKFLEISPPGKLQPEEVLIRIKKIGICGSDIHTYHGEHPAVIYPIVQGHEYAGIVEKIGEKVKSITPGMRVTARPQQVCGQCAPCLRGDYNVCQNLKVEGFQAPGVAQELFVVPAERVVPFPDTVSMDHGAMVEPLSVAAHATRRPQSLKGKNVVVSGAGTIGNLVAQYARIRGAKKVVITDISDYRLQVAKQCGADGIINVNKQSFVREAEETFGGEGFQVAFEAAGAPSALDALVENIENGGEIVIIGVYAKDPVVNMYYLGEHELRLTGSMMYTHEDYIKAVEDLASLKIQIAPLISKHFPFESFKEAYEFIEEEGEKVLKIIIDME